MKKRFRGLLAGLVTVGGLALAGESGANEETFRVTDGLYAGHERGARRPGATVAVELRGSSFVVMETDRVTVGRTEFALRGPGGKDGRLALGGAWFVDGAMMRSGGPGKVRKHKALAALAIWPDGRALLCHTLPGFKGDAIKVPSGSAAPEPSTRCFDLQRFRLAAGSEEAPPDVPAKPGEGVASPCVQKCIDESQMRAVSVEQIEADCRAECAR
jgi:hypothetical protein